MDAKKNVLFLYPDPPGFSGQRRVCELMIECLADHPDIRITAITLPGRPRTGGGLGAMWRFVWQTTKSMLRLFRHAVFGSPSGLFVALCQTRSTLARENAIIRFVRAFNRNIPIAYRLDGSNFTRWRGDEPVAHAFRTVLSYGRFIAVLGPKQESIVRERFLGGALRPVIVPNTCEFDAITEDELAGKHNDTDPICILHLSSLMEPKGFVEVAGAAAGSSNEFTICGAITASDEDTRFDSVADATEWLAGQENQHDNLTWVRGAFGDEKKALFDAASIFVFPSRYKVEAQPLVLLEAMARGCTLITTEIGEIPFMVDNNCAVLLEATDADAVSSAIASLADDPERRLDLAREARHRFLTVFSTQANKAKWHELFRDTYA